MFCVLKHIKNKMGIKILVSGKNSLEKYYKGYINLRPILCI